MAEYISIPLAALECDAFLGAEPVDRATWLCLLRYCFRQLNGGRIEGAANWKNRKLEQILAVTYDELHRGFKPELDAPPPCVNTVENPVENLRKTEKAISDCGKLSTWKSSLWALIGDDVIVKNYPFEIERRIIASRENGRKGGRPPKSFPQAKT